jgi:acyl carrier protein
MKENVTKIVLDCLRELNTQVGSPELENPTLETRLYGAKSALDSIHLVTLIADIEEKIGETFGRDIILADERAMSQKRSPFARVGTLVDYAVELLEAGE